MASSKVQQPTLSDDAQGSKINTARVFQFKITLRGSKPPIWRQIQILETSTFFELHVAIQNAMHGWQSAKFPYHLHQFKFPGDLQISLPPYDDLSMFGIVRRPLKEHNELLQNHFKNIEDRCEYEYDFGDGWVHLVVLEQVVDALPTNTYPLVITGKRACPPEDSGALEGYYEKLEILENPRHKEYKEIHDWVISQTVIQRDGDEEFDPAKFSASSVKFTDSKKALRQYLSSTD